MPEILDETEDKIVIDEKSIFRRIIWFLIGLFLIYLIIKAVLSIGDENLMIAPNTLGGLYLIILLFMIFILGTYSLIDSLIFKTITVDRTIEIIIIKKSIFTIPLKAIREIQFSDIKEFEIEHIVFPFPLDDGTNDWRIKLVTYDNKSEEILYKNSGTCPREIVNKISYLTGKNITQIGF